MARAAAQGPLVPRPQENEQSSDDPAESEAAAVALDTPQADSDAEALTAPGDSARERDTQSETLVPPTASSPHDPYEELAQLADELAAADDGVLAADRTDSGVVGAAVVEEGQTMTEAEPALVAGLADELVEAQLRDDVLGSEETSAAQVGDIAESLGAAQEVFEEATGDEPAAAALENSPAIAETADEASADMVVPEMDFEAAAPAELAPTPPAPGGPQSQESGLSSTPPEQDPVEVSGEQLRPEPSSPEPEAPEPSEAVTGETWLFGERRSAARQARKPLPAALQEAVAAGAAQDESASQAGSGSSTQAQRQQGGGKEADSSTGQDSPKKPGVIRRYGSAIAIVVLFLAAGGAAAGIAAVRGPVTAPLPSTAPQDRAAAGRSVLMASDFPSGWHFSTGYSATSYGLGSALVWPSAISSWLSSHPGCSADLNAVSTAMTPAAGQVTAVTYSQATTTNPLGGPWQIADAVAFHTSASSVRAEMTRIQSLLGTANAQRCVAGYWATALRGELGAGSFVMMDVSPRVSNLPGRPLGWGMEMVGIAVFKGQSLPLRFQISVFAAGRAEVFFVVSSKGAALPGNLAGRLLMDLAVRSGRLAAPTA